MRDRKQTAVIKNRSRGNLLVSASAGAGKTKVLVDRVAHELISNDQLGIGNLLIVTFTRAAAKQMKDRIRKKLQKSINSKLFPNRERILQQIQDLPTANIGTLDSFCQRVVERYYYVIGLDPHFRILNDSTEVILLRDLVWKNVRENLYASDSKPFRQLALNFFNRHINSDDQLTDPLTNLVYALYNSLMLYVDGNPAVNVNRDQWFQAWAKKLTRTYTIGKSLKSSYVYTHLLYPQLRNQFQQILKEYQKADRIASDMKLDRELSTIQAELQAVQKVAQQLKPNQGSWDELRDHALTVARLLKHRFPSKPRKASAEVKQAHVEVKDWRDAGKKAFNAVIDDFLILNEKDNVRIINQSGMMIQELVNVVRKFSQAYRKLKQQRHVMEFIDIERAALDILNQSRAVRLYLRSQFHEIMIDEYQDDNRLQDAILSLVAKHDSRTHEPTNVFMVGDVKQSIYRFRSADPALFLKKDHLYRQPNPNGDQEITLQRNYRSTRNIDRFVNLVFGQIMDQHLGGRKYSDEPEKFGAQDYEEPANFTSSVKTPVHIMVYDEPKSGANHRKSEDDGVRNSTYGQIEMVAHEIKHLIDNPKEKIYDPNSRPHVRMIKPKDIALIASTRDDNVAISDIFRTDHLPVQMLGSQNYFKTTEVQIMLSLLEIIDNPNQDIPLVAVLRSPMVGLDDNQLAYLRINSKTGNYYHAVKKFNHKYPSNGYPRSRTGDQIKSIIQQFLSNLKRFRKVTQRHGLVDLIWNIYQTTGFLDYVGGMPAGTQRQANLHALYERAAQYEQANFHGLFQFVRFIHQLQDQQKDLTEAAPQQSKNMITAVTIHGSKGLEFPIVFLIDASRSFNQLDLRKSYILSNHLGLGIKYFDPKLRSELNTLPYQGITNDERKKDLSEEMRKLYVAMTRAEQRLYIVGQATKTTRAHRDPKAALISHWEDLATGPNHVLRLTDRMSAKNYLDWIGAALVRHPKFQAQFTTSQDLRDGGLQNDSTNFRLTFADDAQILKTQSTNHAIQLTAKPLSDDEKQAIQTVMLFKYPHLAATREGNYRSVSDVKQLFADPNGVEMGQLDQIHHHDDHGLSNQYVTGDFATPAFIQKAAQPKATEIGTATHLVLQMIDLHQAPTLKRINDTIQRLTADQMIDPNVAKGVKPDNIRAFFRSSYGRTVLKHPDDYHRETPFSLLLKASQVIPNEFKPTDPESILIHGIIDGYLYNPQTNQAAIVDYKTDYVDFRHRAASVAKIKDRYRGQLNLYGMALSSIIGRPVQHKYLYLLSSHQLVPIK